MNSRTTRRFRELFAALPAHIQIQARRSYRIFLQNPSHPGLAFKRVHATQPVYSARIGIGYRAVGVMSGEDVVWFWIGSHVDYDGLLKSL
jgi:hypothetical protein